MDVIIAARLSQVAPGQTGIETQDEDSKSWAEVNGHAVVAVVPDQISGLVSPFKRRNLGPWMSDPDKLRQYRGIVAAKQDRLSRAKWRDEVDIRRWAQDNGKELFIVDTGLHWPPSDDVELLRWEFGAIKARQEWEETSKRYRRMQKHLRDNDYLVGRPPFGYRVVEHDNGKTKKPHKTLEPDPATAPYLLGMVDRYLAGATRVAIADWLNTEGITTTSGRTWQIKVITDVLRNPAMIGRRKDGNGKTILRFTPVLTDLGKWRELQHKLDETPRRGPASPDGAMLAGVLFCGKCGGIMHRRRVYNVRKDGSKQYNLYYRCDGTVRRRSTCHNMMPLADMDARVHEMVMTYGDLPHFAIEFTPEQESYQDEIDEIEAELRELYFDAPDFHERQGTLLAERKQYRDMEDERKPDRYGEKATGVTTGEHWQSLDVQGKRAYLVDRKWRVYAHKDEAGELVVSREGGELLGDMTATERSDG